MKRNSVVTFLSGSYFCKNPMISVYINSLNEHFQGRKVILTTDMDSDDRDRFENKGFTIIPVKSNHPKSPFHSRWHHYYEYLRDYTSPEDQVIFSDSKDVLWQADPTPVLEGLLGGKERVVLCSEGIVHKQCEWNSYEQVKFRNGIEAVVPDCSEWEVVNGGCLGGTAKSMKELAFIMDYASLHSDHWTDQAVINHVYHTRKSDPDCPYILTTPDQSFNVTGNTIKIGKQQPTWDGKLLAPDGNPYAMFHQWDRTPFRSEILEQYAT